MISNEQHLPNNLTDMRASFAIKRATLFQTCEHWKAWVVEVAQRRYLCAKCTKGRHRSGTCLKPTDAFWGKYAYTFKREKALALTARLPEVEAGNKDTEQFSVIQATLLHNSVTS